MKEQYLEVGKITNVHGLMGEVRVQPWADSPDFLCQFKTLYVDKTHWPIEVERARVHKNMVILKLNGVTDVNGALAMRNALTGMTPIFPRAASSWPTSTAWRCGTQRLTRSLAKLPTSSLPPPTTCMWYGAASGRL